MSKAAHRLETKLIRAGEPRPRIRGAVIMPIFQSSTFEYGDASDYHSLRYIRLNNTPNHEALHEKLAALENAEAALVTSSGMAAITTALLTIVSAGEHVLVQDCLYGGTHDFVTKDLHSFGIAHDFIDAANPDSWKAKLRQTTKVIYVETMSNPLLQIPDLRNVVEFARKNGLVAIIDNTFASPVNFRPAEWGYDLSIHSATKYLNGHSDIVAGAIIGRGDLIRNIKVRLDRLGGSLDPHAAFLLHRGMKTLALRVRFQNDSALRIAQFLQQHSAIKAVQYPGLQEHAGHARAREFFNGFGGMLSFELRGDVERANRFVKRLTLPILAPSLGGVETLISRPAVTSHSGMSPEARHGLGISDQLIRLSVGIEATDDLIQDFSQALDQS